MADAQEVASLLLVRSGMPFEALCSRLIANLGELQGVEQAGQYLATWVSEGLVADISKH